MANPLTLDEIRAHPALPTAIPRLTPTQSGAATVAADRVGGPISLAYEVHGTGPIHIVWITGLNAPKIAWWRQMRYFGHEHGDEYSNVVFDNRGIGESSVPWARYTTSEMARDVLDLVEHLGWTEKRQLHVVGVSMGGMIAQELAYLIPERIASLCLQSTAASLVITIPWYKHLYGRIRMIMPKSLSASLESAKSYLFSEEWLKRPDDEGVFPTNADRYVAEELWRRKELNRPAYQGFLLQGLAASWHYVGAERLKKIGEGIPDILVCTGSKDAMIEHKHSEVLVEGLKAGGANVQMRVFEGCGHVLNWEANDEYNGMIKEFVRAAHDRYRSG